MEALGCLTQSQRRQLPSQGLARGGGNSGHPTTSTYIERILGLRVLGTSLPDVTQGFIKGQQGKSPCGAVG